MVPRRARGRAADPDAAHRVQRVVTSDDDARYLATACSRLKNILSRPRVSPSGERWTIASTPGLKPKPEEDAGRALSLLGFGQHLERGVLEVEHAAQVERHDLRLHLGD